MKEEQMRTRAKAYADDDLRKELEISIVTGAPIRRKFRLQLWKIVTGSDWQRDDKKLGPPSGIKRCGACKHFVKGERGSYSIICALGKDWCTCNNREEVEMF